MNYYQCCGCPCRCRVQDISPQVGLRLSSGCHLHGEAECECGSCDE